MRESFDGFGTPKRPLTDVKEEPQEREEEWATERKSGWELSYDCKFGWEILSEMLYRRGGQQRAMADIFSIADRFTDASSNNRASEQSMGMPSPNDYDLVDDARREEDFAPNPCAKRRCPEDSILSGMTSRFGTRFPSFSHRWKNRKSVKTTSVADSLQETVVSRSRANSTRAPSLIDSIVDPNDRPEYPLPPTPARSLIGDARDDVPVSPIDIQKANGPYEGDEENERLATTPLLPPLMIQKLSEEPVQSPLQSPTIAESSNVHTPTEAPLYTGLPSPPLSTKPSISSFHRRQLAPSSDVAQFLLADQKDEWANKLGHANFTIQPEPYLPTNFDFSACKQLRCDWDIARCNYMKHLVRIGEHYSTTSKIYHLTEEKWAYIDAQWKRNNERTISRTADHNGDEELALSHHSSVAIEPPAALIKIPSLNGPMSQGKFPKLGDEDIVGPMVRDKSPTPAPRKSRKRKFWKFLQGVLPSSVAFGRA